MTYKLNPFTGKLDTSDGPQGPAGVVSAAGPGSQGTPSISFAADLDTGLYNYTPNGIAVSTGGAGRLFIDSSGRVGIGTQTPSRGPLHLHQAGATNTYLKLTNGTTGETAGDGTEIIVKSGGGLLINNRESTEIAFATAATERLRITSTGELLHIGGGSVGSPGVYFAGSAPSNSLYVQATTGNVGVNTSNPTHNLTIGSTAPSDFVLAFRGGVGGFLGWDDSANCTILQAPNTRSLQFRVNSDTFSAGTMAMHINSSGNVGIGTSSPDANLHIRQDQASFTGIYLDNRTGSGGSYSGISFGTNTAGTPQWFVTRANYQTANLEFALNLGSPLLTLTPTGNVGIGTQTPGASLEIARTNGGALRINTTTTNGGYMSFRTNNANIGFLGAADQLSNGSSTDLNIRSENNLSFSSNGDTERARIDSSGRLLVGTSTARSNFDGNTATPLFQIEGVTAATSSASIVRDANDLIGSTFNLGKTRATAVNENTVVSSGDQIGIINFQAADGTNLIDAASIQAAVDGTPGADDMPGRLVFSTTADGANSPTERMRITSGGRTVISGDTTGTIAASATTSPFLLGASTASTNPGLEVTTGNTATRYHAAFSNPNGIVGTITTNGSATAYNETSDYRLKENVVPLTGAIDRLNQLQVRRFNFIADPDTTVDGFLAHEAQEVVPESVNGEKDAVDENGNPKYQGIDKSKLVPLLTAALQEALAEIESLKARVTALEP